MGSATVNVCKTSASDTLQTSDPGHHRNIPKSRPPTTRPPTPPPPCYSPQLPEELPSPHTCPSCSKRNHTVSQQNQLYSRYNSGHRVRSGCSPRHWAPSRGTETSAMAATAAACPEPTRLRGRAYLDLCLIFLLLRFNLRRDQRCSGPGAGSTQRPQAVAKVPPGSPARQHWWAAAPGKPHVPAHPLLSPLGKRGESALVPVPSGSRTAAPPLGAGEALTEGRTTPRPPPPPPRAHRPPTPTHRDPPPKTSRCNGAPRPLRLGTPHRRASPPATAGSIPATDKVPSAAPAPPPTAHLSPHGGAEWLRSVPAGRRRRARRMETDEGGR